MQLLQKYSPMLIPIGPKPGEIASMPRRSAVAEAQAEGLVLWEMKKTAARDAWREIEPGLRFIANTVDPAAGPTLYRTGDRARFLADGRVQVLGRMDAQIKLRGFRIEPGEIESVLARLPNVSACAVGLREAGPGDQRLVAWVVARPAAGVTGAGLRERLKKQLPDYMVPATVVLMDALPLTPNGKLDRRALPAPAAAAWATCTTRADCAVTGAGFAAPRDPVETVLCELFAEVLGAPSPVGIDADFFALGGHSLLATRLVSRIRDALETELPLQALFEASTPAALARSLGECLATSPAPEAMPVRATIEPSSGGGGLPVGVSEHGLLKLFLIFPLTGGKV